LEILWLVAAIGLALVLWTIRSTGRMLYPPARALMVPPSLPAFRTIELTASDGSRFDAWILDHPAPRGVLIACHGYGANRLQISEAACGLSAQGYAVLLSDLRGHGTRPGPCTFGLREVDDVGAMLTWISRQPALASLPAGILGWSLGASVACQALARYQALRAAVLDSAYARLFPIVVRAIRRNYRYLPTRLWAVLTWWGAQAALRRRLAPRDPVVSAASQTKPALLIHGSEDQTVPVDDHHALYAAWRGPKAQWVVPGPAHVGTFAHDPAGYSTRVATFFDEWLHR